MASALQLIGNLAQWLPGSGDRKREGVDVPKAPAKAGKRLELLLPFNWPDSGGNIKWCVFAADGPELQGEATSLEDLAADHRELPLLVYLDAGDTAILTAKLPSMSRKNLAKAIPFTLEDRILGDIEHQFFTWKKNREGVVTACVIRHERMRAVLDSLKSGGLQPQSIMPAVFAAPMLENSWTLVFNGRNGWLRMDALGGLACTVDDTEPPFALVKMLAEAKAQETAPSALLLINMPDDMDANEWASQLGLEIILPEGRLWENLQRGEPEFNLLHGPYAQKSASQASFRKLLPAAVMAIVLLVGNLGLFGWNWYGLIAESNSIHAQMVQIFKQSFPAQASVLTELPARMQKNLDLLRETKGGARQTDFLALLGPVSRALSEGHATGASLENIRYSNGSITVSIRLANYQELDRFKKTVADKQLSLEVVQADSDNNGVRATLKLGNTPEVRS